MSGSLESRILARQKQQHIRFANQDNELREHHERMANKERHAREKVERSNSYKPPPFSVNMNQVPFVYSGNSISSESSHDYQDPIPTRAQNRGQNEEGTNPNWNLVAGIGSIVAATGIAYGAYKMGISSNEKDKETEDENKEKEDGADVDWKVAAGFAGGILAAAGLAYGTYKFNQHIHEQKIEQRIEEEESYRRFEKIYNNSVGRSSTQSLTQPGSSRSYKQPGNSSAHDRGEEL